MENNEIPLVQPPPTGDLLLEEEADEETTKQESLFDRSTDRYCSYENSDEIERMFVIFDVAFI